jgi:hypothetical protein
VIFSLQFFHTNLPWILICQMHASCYAHLNLDLIAKFHISWRVDIMNFLLWDFLSSRFFVSVKPSCFALHSCLSYRKSKYFPRIRAQFSRLFNIRGKVIFLMADCWLSPLLWVWWSEDFYALRIEYSYVLFHTTTVIIPHTTLNMYFIICMHFLIHIR